MAGPDSGVKYNVRNEHRLDSLGSDQWIAYLVSVLMTLILSLCANFAYEYWFKPRHAGSPRTTGLFAILIVVALLPLPLFVGQQKKPARVEPFEVSVLQQLQGAANRAATNVGPGSGPTYGTTVHNAFQREVDALGNANLTTEQSYLNGNPVRRGTPGSVRLDVVEGPLDNPKSIYDLKTGNAKLTLARIQQIQSHLPGGSTVPITEVRP